MSRIALFPGSFDPVTLGHMDLIRRSSSLFDQVVVAVIHNPNKRGWLPMEERVRLLQRCTEALPNVTVDSFSGLTVAYARQIGAQVIVRGLRNSTDFAMEQNLAQVNHRLQPDIETLCLMCAPEHAVVSSSNVRELAAYGCSLVGYVPEEIRLDIEHFSHQ